MKPFILFFAFLLISNTIVLAQYEFNTTDEITCTPVKSQDKTGTCWSFSTVSFLESELIRLGKSEYDLSEMFIVRTIYQDKAQNYLLRQGKANFSQGSLSHDVIRAVAKAGIVPESIYSGKIDENDVHNHGLLVKDLKSMLDEMIKQKNTPTDWRKAFDDKLDHSLGKVEQSFSFFGKKFTPKTFAENVGIVPEDYISLTSYSHHPFYEQFILEIPDNYSNGLYYNLPIDELQEVVDQALKDGFTVVWDGDVSEKGFSAGKGLAILPDDPSRADLFDNPGKELTVDQDLRQQTFETFSTTDDHLMHLTGIVKDQNGTNYYITKNSWGSVGPYKGFLNMSSAYFRLKTVGVLIHKDALPEKVRKKLNL